LHIVFTDVLGIALVFFSLTWLVLGVITIASTPRRQQLMSFILILIVLDGFGAYLGLTASTPFRRAYINLDMRALASSLLQDGTGFILGVLIALALYVIASRAYKQQHWRFLAISSIGLIAVFVGVLGYLYAVTFSPDLDQVTTDTVSTSDITIVDKIPISFFENKVVKAPTAMELGPDGELYVASLNGFIWTLKDTNNDNVADSVIEFASGLTKPEGLAWSKDGLYVNVAGALVLMTDSDGDGKADKFKTIVDGFPSESYAFHQNNGLVFGPDGRLYLGSGSTTAHREETNPKAARIFSMNPDGSDFKVYATGIRNPFGIIPAPDGKGFFAVDNGSSGCIDTENETDNCADPIDVPEEVNFIYEGGDYGFPNYFGVPPQDSNTEPPMVTLPDHSAPTGIELYTGDKLPAKYNGRLIVSMWLRNEVVSVIFHKIDDKHYTGESRPFISGLLGPSSVINAPNGGLFISSFSGNAIYYIGNK
jgi:putative membrane-bound dehydrogenase-like protein